MSRRANVIDDDRGRPVLTATQLLAYPTAPDAPVITGGIDPTIPVLEVPDLPSEYHRRQKRRNR